jgi:hypothetical protein
MLGVMAAALAVLLLSSGMTAAQGSRPAEPNVFDRIVNWFDRSATDLKETFSDFDRFGNRTRDAVKDAAVDVGESAESLAGLPNARIVSKRTLCPAATNGGPDCRRVAQAVCRHHGFTSGKSFEIRSEEKCSVEALLARRLGQSATCRTETYILRAICQ